MTLPPAATIVDIGPDRYPECLSVLREGFATVVDEYGITAENTPSNPAFWGAEAVASVVARGFALFAVEDAGGIAGCAFAGPSRSRPRTWGLRHLAVLPGVRHRGYGEALVAEAARRARGDGADTLAIGIVAENAALGAWYHRLGFTTVDRARYDGLVFTVEHLELSLR